MILIKGTLSPYMFYEYPQHYSYNIITMLTFFTDFIETSLLSAAAPT